MERLALVIQRNVDTIVRRWTDAVHDTASARGWPAPELDRTLIARLSAVADGSASTSELRDHLSIHLSSRFRSGIELSALVEELVALEEAIVSTTDPREEVAPAAWRRLSSAVRRSIVLISELFQERVRDDEDREKRCLRLIQSVAGDALHTSDRDSIAQNVRFVELIVEALNAQSGALLVFEPTTDRLITKESTGLAHEALDELASSLDPATLGGRVAARTEASAATEVAVNEQLRREGIQSLLGVRLPRYRTLSGVLYVGFRDERVFTPQERRRLETLAEHLAIHLDSARLYAELRAHVEDLQVERDLREKFVAILAHDLRGPLSTAKTGAQILVRHPDSFAEGTSIALRIERNLELMDQMIRDLLDVSRVRAGQRMPLRLDSCDLGTVAREVREHLVATHGDRFDLHVVGTVRGVWSEQELRRALWNLSVNAVKYGAPDASITLTVEHTPTGARVSVHNFGKVISRDDQQGLFDPYSRVRGSPSNAGWGLGLALVRACAEAHGGTVSVRSEPEMGTTFAIDLPLDSMPAQVNVEPRVSMLSAH